jgi:hypothetical protein
VDWSGTAIAIGVSAALAGIALYAFHDVVWPGAEHLPGNDAVNLYFWELFTRKALAAGVLPHWNPFHMSGAPHLADTQTTVLYPPAMLLRVLPPLAFLPWMAALHVWIAGIGAVLLARTLGLSWLSSLAAGLATMLGGSTGPWLHNGHLLVLYCASWLPWALAFAMRSVRRDTNLPHPGLVVVMVLQFLAGYLQGSLYLTLVVVAYFGFCSLVLPADVRSRVRRRPLVQLVIVGVLAIGLSAFQLLPVLRLTAVAGRTEGLPYAVASEGGLHLVDLARVFFPFRGMPGDPPYRFMPDTLAYVGWLLAILAPFAFVERRRRHAAMFLALVTAVVFVFACAADLPAYRLHYLIAPGLRIPGRVLFIATVTLAALGAMGLETFVDLCRARCWRAAWLPGAVSAVMVAGAAAVTLPHAWPVELSHEWPLLPWFGIAAVFMIAGLAAARRPRAAQVVAVGAIAFDLITFALPAAQSVPIVTPAAMRDLMGPPDAGRALSTCENRIGPGELLANDQATVDGLAGMHLADYADWAAIAKSSEAPPHDGLYRRLASEGPLPARPDLLDLANVSTVYSCEPLDAAGLTLVAHVGAVYRYRRETVWPRAFWTCDAGEATAADAIAWLLAGRYDDRRRMEQQPSINVRWAEGTSDAERRKVEVRRALRDGTSRDGRTWRYALADWSRANALALIADPAVEDTSGIDRGTGVVTTPMHQALRVTHGGGYWMTGASDCPDEGRVDMQADNRLDGRTFLQVDAPADGFVFVGDSYYPERHAFVDGRPVAALRGDLAFTLVAVPAGLHRIELRYEPRSFRIGLGISLLTLLAWVAVPRLPRNRRVSQEPAGAA